MTRCAHPKTKVVRDPATPHVETVQCTTCGLARVRARESWVKKHHPKRRSKR